MPLSRRSVLRASTLAGLGAAAVAVPVGGAVRAKSASLLDPRLLPRLWQREITRPEPLRPSGSVTKMVAGREVRLPLYELIAREGTTEISPSQRTRIWGYDGRFPGPLLEVERGAPVVVRVRNKLPAKHPLFDFGFSLSTHLHGGASRPQYDGYANDLTRPGFYKDYLYENSEPARTSWYHDHAVHTTAMSVYSGLAAMYLVHDNLERSLLPQGAYDIPLVVSDCILDAAGELAHLDNDRSGLWGDVILVNGVPWPYLRVEPRVYRLRIVVASIGRSYRFGLSNGAPLHIVATDGGLVPAAQRVSRWRHGNGERYEVLVDFSTMKGQTVELINLSNPNNVDYDRTRRVLQFRVGTTVTDRTNDRVPAVLAPAGEAMTVPVADAVRTRTFKAGRKGGEWVINDETWADVVASNFQRIQANPGLGDVEVWTFETSGGWFHPMHTHLVDFRVLSRDGRPPFPWERGPKDTVYVGGGERVRVLLKFGPHRGRYMLHCHNGSHEDHDMMTQYGIGVTQGKPDPDDPVAAAPPVVDDLP